MKVRCARLGDSAALAALSGQLGYPTTTHEMMQRLKHLIRHPSHLVLVAEGIDGLVQGWVHAFLRRALESGASVEIAGLVVEENARGQGVGKVLLESAERWARRKRCRRITVRSNVVRKRAHAFYQRLGYKTVKTQRVFQKAV